MADIKRYKKGIKFPITDNFSSDEFDCECRLEACDTTLIDTDMVEMLQELRDTLHAPLIVTSGFRCQAHQENLKKQGYETGRFSRHLKGDAADIKSPSISAEKLENIARSVGFKAVGVGSHGIHVDMRSDKIRAWGYKKGGRI